MKAMILAAGRGTRLRPLTATCPKPMIPIAGRPLLEYTIRLLARHGFDELVVNLHHLPQAIQDHFGDGRAWDVKLTYSYEKELLGTAGAVRKMADFFDQRFLVYYGDHLSNADLTALLQFHERTGGPATLGLLWKEDPSASGIVELDSNHRVQRFIEKPGTDQVFDNYLVNAGIYVLEPEIMEWIPASSPCDFGHDVFPALLADGRPIYGHQLQGKLLSTDTLERYRDTQQQVAAQHFTLP
jgi:mannose-1-phosphate guanylyltransferase